MTVHTRNLIEAVVVTSGLPGQSSSGLLVTDGITTTPKYARFSETVTLSDSQATQPKYRRITETVLVQDASVGRDANPEGAVVVTTHARQSGSVRDRPLGVAVPGDRAAQHVIVVTRLVEGEGTAGG